MNTITMPEVRQKENRAIGRKLAGYNPTEDEIINLVSIVFGCEPDQIKGRFYKMANDGRKASILIFQKIRPDLTFERLGELMNRDYSTIIHLNYRAQDLLFSDKIFRSKVEYITNQLHILIKNETHAA